LIAIVFYKKEASHCLTLAKEVADITALYVADRNIMKESTNKSFTLISLSHPFCSK
jgi:roadblock/LC7 domain-containing protein